MGTLLPGTLVGPLWKAALSDATRRVHLGSPFLDSRGPLSEEENHAIPGRCCASFLVVSDSLCCAEPLPGASILWLLPKGSQTEAHDVLSAYDGPILHRNVCPAPSASPGSAFPNNLSVLLITESSVPSTVSSKSKVGTQEACVGRVDALCCVQVSAWLPRFNGCCMYLQVGRDWGGLCCFFFRCWGVPQRSRFAQIQLQEKGW